jgi:hypothetical protein
MKTDSIYNTPQKNIDDFRFDQQVVDVFQDMITRSVPMLQKVGISAISPPTKQLKSSMPKCITKQRDWV